MVLDPETANTGWLEVRKMYARPLTFALLLAAAAAGCAASTHPVGRATLGKVWSTGGLEAVVDRPGPVEVETVVGADWTVSRAGLINLEHPKARSANLTDGEEPIQVYAHVLRHPTQGVFLVDTGVSRRIVEDPARVGVGWIVRKALHPERMRIGVDTASLLSRLGQPLAGVLLTHLHLDHITGLPDIPRGTPIYIGPGEASQRAFLNLFGRGSTDGVLQGHAELRQWSFAPDPDQRQAGVIDVFGDGSVAAIWVPGHTAGSTAYLVRTPRGPVLFTGDTCHTRWGWDNGVEPGTFTMDGPRNAAALTSLRVLVSRHPSIDVRLGHQR
jgi:N-acyl homoserine lactone hydrolase